MNYCGAVHTYAGSCLLLTAALTVSWMLSMRIDEGELHFTSTEIKVSCSVVSNIGTVSARINQGWVSGSGKCGLRLLCRTVAKTSLAGLNR